MPTIDQKLAAVHGYVSAFSAGDVDAAVALYAKDATVEDPVGTPIHAGEAAICTFYTTAMATGAKLTLQGNPRFAGDAVAFAFTVTLDWGGQQSAIEVIDTFRLDDAGKIIEMRAFWGPENMKPA